VPLYENGGDGGAEDVGEGGEWGGDDIKPDVIKDNC
jgi:hypothetical protein